VGLLLPGTRREDELMGSARDQLVERAEETAGRVKEVAGEAAREVTEQATESAGRVTEATKEALKEQTGGMGQAL
jgi:vacuolar-type H+-ATPase subunit H